MASAQQLVSTTAPLLPPRRSGRLFDWLFDVVFALGNAVAFTMLFFDKDKLMTNMAEVPLVEGRSATARDLCPPLLEEIQKILMQQQQQQRNETSSRPAASSTRHGSVIASDDMDHTDKHVDDDDDDDFLYSPRQLLQHPQTAPLASLVKFAENYQRRKIMEQSLRRERGDIAADSSMLPHIEISAPGVPARHACRFV
jgi:hypothetical protein